MGVMILVPGADYSGISLGRATPSENIPIEGITIYGPGAAYGTATYTGRVWPTFTNQREYTWSIVSGGTYANINASSGQLTVSAGTTEQPVTIRCTSLSDPNIYTEKTIICDSGVLTYYNYLVGDGTDYILIDRFPSLIDATVTCIYTTGDIANGYMLSNLKGSASLGQAQTYALYLQSTGSTSRVSAGTKATSNITSTNARTRRHRSVLQLSSKTTLADGVFTAYDDATNEQLVKYEAFTCYLGSYFCAFGLCRAESTIDEATVNNMGNGKFYRLIVEKAGETLADYRPCTINGSPCLNDYISGFTYYPVLNTGGITAGND